MSTKVRVIVSLLTSYGLTAFFVPLLIALFKSFKIGQSIREDGPEGHLAKRGTPTMGGISFIASASAASLIFAGPSPRLLLMLLAFIGYGAIGFADDYIKVVKKRNLGLTARQKIFLQAGLAFIVSCYASGSGTDLFVPFFKTSIDIRTFYVPSMIFIFLAMSNSVNLTDGLDGLAAGVTSIVAITLAVIGYAAKDSEVSIFMAAIYGGCMGFLMYNKNPAKIFMGDTGSMALGGALAAGAIMSGYELILPIAGGIYVAEALSVIIQVFVFKTQGGRRFFRMAPLHHHFELGGIPERSVVRRFMIATLVLCIISLAGVLPVR